MDYQFLLKFFSPDRVLQKPLGCERKIGESKQSLGKQINHPDHQLISLTILGDLGEVGDVFLKPGRIYWFGKKPFPDHQFLNQLILMIRMPEDGNGILSASNQKLPKCIQDLLEMRPNFLPNVFNK